MGILNSLNHFAAPALAQFVDHQNLNLADLGKQVGFAQTLVILGLDRRKQGGELLEQAGDLVVQGEVLDQATDQSCLADPDPTHQKQAFPVALFKVPVQEFGGS